MDDGAQSGGVGAGKKTVSSGRERGEGEGEL